MFNNLLGSTKPKTPMTINLILIPLLPLLSLKVLKNWSDLALFYINININLLIFNHKGGFFGAKNAMHVLRKKKH